MKFAVVLSLFASLALASPIQKRGRESYYDFTDMTPDDILKSINFETSALVPYFLGIRQDLLDLKINPRQFLCGSPAAYKSDETESSEVLRSAEAEVENILQQDAETDEATESEEGDATAGVEKRLVDLRGDRREQLQKILRKLQMYEQETRHTFMAVQPFYCRSEYWARD